MLPRVDVLRRDVRRIRDNKQRRHDQQSVVRGMDATPRVQVQRSHLLNSGSRDVDPRAPRIEFQRRQGKFLELEDLERLAADLAVAPPAWTSTSELGCHGNNVASMA